MFHQAGSRAALFRPRQEQAALTSSITHVRGANWACRARTEPEPAEPVDSEVSHTPDRFLPTTQKIVQFNFQLKTLPVYTLK